MTKSRDNAVNTAKRVKLQTRLKTRSEQEKLEKVFGKKISFLDQETSLALYNKINASHLWHSKFCYSNFTTIEFEENFGTKLEMIAQCFSDNPETTGYCFPLSWSSSGAILIELSELISRLNEHMFAFNDELRFYTPDLTKVIHLTGERTGSWDQLNELSISVLGADWVRKIEKLNSSTK